jgi:chromosome partitioning protein
MRTISILNFKGGVGKSSVAQNLGYALATFHNLNVLIIDGDRQSNTTTTLLHERKSPSLTDVLTNPKLSLSQAIYEARPHLFVVPSDTDLDHASTYIKEHPRAYYKVRDSLTSLNDKIDILLVDQAGAYSTVMGSLLESCKEMLVPCKLEPYSTLGLADMFEKLGNEMEDHELSIAGIIPYDTDMSKLMTSSYLAELQEAYGPAITPQVRTDTAVPYAQSQDQTVFEYEISRKRKSHAAEDFKTLASHIIEGIA